VNAAVRFHLIAHILYGHGPVGRALGKIVYWVGRVVTLADIDPRCEIDATVLVPHGAGVVIGETARIGARTRIMPGVVVGAVEWDSHKRHATIGADVVVGAGAKVLGPVTVGDGARIGANAVVLNDVAPGITVVGVPARPTNS
jgi:serine O-acetyltransferase